jgi:hypothetical protein
MGEAASGPFCGRSAALAALGVAVASDHPTEARWPSWLRRALSRRARAGRRLACRRLRTVCRRRTRTAVRATVRRRRPLGRGRGALARGVHCPASRKVRWRRWVARVAVGRNITVYNPKVSHSMLENLDRTDQSADCWLQDTGRSGCSRRQPGIVHLGFGPARRQRDRDDRGGHDTQRNGSEGRRRAQSKAVGPLSRIRAWRGAPLQALRHPIRNVTRRGRRTGRRSGADLGDRILILLGTARHTRLPGRTMEPGPP